MTSPSSLPREPVVIEYTSRGVRVTKSFIDPYAARRFWIQKDKAGKTPRVLKS